MIVTLDDVKAHLGITDTTDDALITGKIEAAQAHIETALGYEIESEFTTVPADLREAVRQLAAHWFENREASVVGVSAMLVPLSVDDVVRNHRRYSFGSV